MSRQYTLGKNERLKGRKLIERLFSEGKSFSVARFKVYYLLNFSATARSPFNLQFGVGVPGRSFKRAVDRNRMKRLIRESYRLQKKDLQETLKEKKVQLTIFFVYTAKELSAFYIIKEKVDLILNKMIKIINEDNSAGS